MGINFKKRILMQEQVLKKCDTCKKLYQSEDNFCSICGSKLTSERTKVYANLGKKGISSYSYVLPDGTTINSRNGMTIPLGNGMSYTTRK